MDYNVEGLITLRNAIVEQAVKDYARVKRYLLTHPNRPCVLQKAELEQIQRFFLSDSFVECDGEYIIKKLDRMIEEDLRKGKKTYAKRIHLGTRRTDNNARCFEDDD